jgi:hypothetical protein
MVLGTSFILKDLFLKEQIDLVFIELLEVYLNHEPHQRLYNSERGPIQIKHEISKDPNSS